MLFEEYLRELADTSIPIKVSRLTHLSDLSPEQREELAGVWPAIDEGRRRQVVSQLVDLAEDNVDLNFDAVYFVALTDGDEEVRVEAVRGLWEYQGRDLIPHLLRLLARDGSTEVRSEAALALGRFVLLSEYGNLRDRYFAQIEGGLRRALADHKEVEEVRARALEAIGACSGRTWVRQAIREAYESDTSRMKVSAIHAMGRSADSRWLPLLFRELASEDGELRYEVAVALGSIGDEEAVSRLANLLRDEDAEVRQAAIAALGEIGGAEAKTLLMGLLEESLPAVREAAREALTEIDFGEDPLAFRFRS
ncbi:MAG: HEAT repeat domain-containing protein [Chloroflexi bacterium]|nr:HEAT repeat domain-containing protein [Chloroflexota bacterium]